jgi:hypothetical protein
LLQHHHTVKTIFKYLLLMTVKHFILIWKWIANESMHELDMKHKMTKNEAILEFTVRKAKANTYRLISGIFAVM